MELIMNDEMLNLLEIDIEITMKNNLIRQKLSI